jgi:hypothetical protein
MKLLLSLCGVLGIAACCWGFSSVGVGNDIPTNKVDWHEDFDAACQASRDSGKPVLLFQLMGRLDEVFC